METELYKKHRPTLWKQVVGQDEAVSLLQNHLKNRTLPHAILFTVPSGTGKNTLAYILARKLGCNFAGGHFTEQNCADCRGIDDVRTIIRYTKLAGGPRIWLLDEVHKLTNEAQNALLNVLEKTPNNVYFFLLSSEPNRVIKAVLTRCTPIGCRSLHANEMEDVINFILNKEEKEIGSDIMQKLVEASEGSARQALVLLESILQMETEEEQLNVILTYSAKEQAIQLFRVLIDGRSRWPDVAKVLKVIEDDVEKIRLIVMACAAKALLTSPNNKRARKIADKFQFDWDRIKRSGMIVACHEVIHSK